MDYKNSILTVVGMNDKKSISGDTLEQLGVMVKGINASPMDEKEHGLMKWIAIKAILTLLAKHNIELDFHDKRTTESTLRVLTAKLKITYDELLDMIEGLLITLCAENITGPAPMGELLEYVGEIEERYSDSLYCKIQSYIEGLYEDSDEDEVIEEKEEVVDTEIVTSEVENGKEIKEEESVTVDKVKVVENEKVTPPTGDSLDILTVIKDLESAIVMTKMTETDKNNSSVTLEVRVTNFKIKKEALDVIVKFLGAVSKVTYGGNMKTILKLLKLAEEIQAFNNFNILHRVENIAEIKANAFNYLLDEYNKNEK